MRSFLTTLAVAVLVVAALLALFWVPVIFEWRAVEAIRSQLQPGMRVSEIPKAWEDQQKPSRYEFAALVKNGRTLIANPRDLQLEPGEKFQSEAELWQAMEMTIQASQVEWRIRITWVGRWVNFFNVFVKTDGTIERVTPRSGYM